MFYALEINHYIISCWISQLDEEAAERWTIVIMQAQEGVVNLMSANSQEYVLQRTFKDEAEVADT